MAEIIGPGTILTKALPTGTDGIRIAQWEMRSGRTFLQVIQDLALAIAGVNADFISDWGWLFSVTEDQYQEYFTGGEITDMPEITDVDKINAISGETIGHMIELVAYGRAIGGSKRFFRDARQAQIDANIRTIIDQAIWRFEKLLLNRWFTNTETLIGALGYNVPFVRGDSGNVDWAPPAFGGERFLTTHDHYLGVDSDALGFGDMLNQLAETVQEHGHAPPYVAMTSRADIASYEALTRFIEPLPQQVIVVDRGGETSGPNFYSNMEREFGVIGGYKSDYGYIEIRATNRVPTGYAGLVKSYGQNNAKNPLAVRVHPDVGFGLYIVTETTTDYQYPVKQVSTEFEFGIGVGRDRAAGAAAYLVSGGAWTNPTIT